MTNLKQFQLASQQDRIMAVCLPVPYKRFRLHQFIYLPVGLTFL